MLKNDQTVKYNVGEGATLVFIFYKNNQNIFKKQLVKLFCYQGWIRTIIVKSRASSPAVRRLGKFVTKVGFEPTSCTFSIKKLKNFEYDLKMAQKNREKWNTMIKYCDKKVLFIHFNHY